MFISIRWRMSRKSYLFKFSADPIGLLVEQWASKRQTDPLWSRGAWFVDELYQSGKSGIHHANSDKWEKLDWFRT